MFQPIPPFIGAPNKDNLQIGSVFNPIISEIFTQKVKILSASKICDMSDISGTIKRLSSILYIHPEPSLLVPHMCLITVL